MRAGGGPAVVLLLVFTTVVLQVTSAGDLYWEGEEDASNEFLEVKEENHGIKGTLKRLKRQWWNLLGSSSDTEPSSSAAEAESVTEDQGPVDEERSDGKNDDFDNGGSGIFGGDREPEPGGEKTLRVTFVVNQPYQTAYSNRDSVEFQTFSRSLADAVNVLFESIPGTQRASLVRIQSRVSDEFTCKVTLDIVTTGYDDTASISKMLEDHIYKTRTLGSVVVSEMDFSSTVIDPAYNSPIESCATDELQCENGMCVANTARCNGIRECADGSDEAGCPRDDWSVGQEQSSNDTGAEQLPASWAAATLPTPAPTSWLPWTSIFGNNEDSNTNIETTTTRFEPVSENITCPTDELRCDHTRCVSLAYRCDGHRECNDGADEADCGEKSCGEDDFRCNDGMCIEAFRRCDRIVDCTSSMDDERNCVCTKDEFSCDGFCFDNKKLCDGLQHCSDSSDERNCAPETCPAGSFTCNPGSRQACATLCDGRSECDGGEDETNCGSPAEDCNHVCDGRCLDDALICNRVNDCTDGTDEQECDYCDGPNDFRCSNGENCLHANQRCNSIMECSDNSDEADCHEIIQPSTCKSGQFQCRNGVCVNDEFVCDGEADCSDRSDEENCPTTPHPCPFGSFVCDPRSRQKCAMQCDGRRECDGGEDESNCGGIECNDDSWRCDSGQCIPGTRECDGTPDCNDGSDEKNCAITPSWEPPTAFPDYPPFFTASTTLAPITTTSNFGIYNRPEQNFPGYLPNRPRQPEYQPSSNGYLPNRPDYQPNGPVHLKLRTVPEDEFVRYGGDVVFQCRDESQHRAPVKWVRENNMPIKQGSTDIRGRLEMFGVTPEDSGVYICQAVGYLQYPGSSVNVKLQVDNNPVTQAPQRSACRAHEATCGNGQCILKSSVCDGRIDCTDRSDEELCPSSGVCEPSQFQCANKKCVLKTWRCDSEDDCGDGSDEEGCEAQDHSQFCRSTEFTCTREVQCIPRNYHCDTLIDCRDGTDEIGCGPIYIKRPPMPSNVKLNPGENLVLTCEAVGVPTPLISWRLNWGHVPAKCKATSHNGVGNLTCINMQPEDSGAYSCEAINHKGTSFASPDSIVHVVQTNICPAGYFNSEARSQNECIRCFCFGESSQCQSAELFIYHMPTPLGEGGTRLLGVIQSYDGEIQVDSRPITDQYYYDERAIRNGAVVTKLEQYPPRDRSSDAHAYLTLPEMYTGNQLTSYGGHIKYRLTLHSQRYSSSDDLPDIIIKGKYRTLAYQRRSNNAREIAIEARLTPENWRKPSSSGLIPVTREDIMMALDNIEMILLRADLNNAGVNISDFVMESAKDVNLGLGAANLVEECTCPPGYEGLSCQKCASGYIRDRSGNWLGNCVREQKPCPPGTYGDPSSGYGCRPCPCPLTNPQNQFARTCSVGPSGRVVCDCAPGYGGQTCEYCEPGYVGNPMMPGDSCRPQTISNCNPVGTLRSPLPDECQCKDKVQGRYCDQCKDDSFFLSEDFRHGCASCFCTGVSHQCMSSNLRRKTTRVKFNTPQIVQQVKIYSSAPLGPSSLVKYNAPVETELRPQLVRGELTLSEFDRSRAAIYYWSLPYSFAGDKVTSYGGYLRYTLRHISPTVFTRNNNAADIQLISENNLAFHHYSNDVPSSDGTLNASVQFLEKGWRRQDGKEISREHFLLALADVKAILIKATYTNNEQLASLESASIDTAEPNGNGPQALHVEQCICPAGYVGTSCEDCAPGYTRSSSGLYLEHCGPCNCNGHSNMCHPETGVCSECKDNTVGDNCEECRPGYTRNAYGSCVTNELTTSPPCTCDPRGEMAPCDAFGLCHCKPNVEGDSCDRCRPGTFGLDGKNPYGCLQCYCSGVTNNCHEGTHYSRIPIAAPIIGDNYGGYSITDLNAQQVYNDHFVPAPNESELMYMFPSSPSEELYWSLPVFPGNRVLSYGGTLSLTQKIQSGGYSVEVRPGVDVVLVGDRFSLYWSNPNQFVPGEALSYQVPLQEDGWHILNTNNPASRDNFMAVLKNLRRVLVRATLADDILSTAIADVSMDTATQYIPDAPAAKGVEVCICPEGHTGTSCETCLPGYYQDQQDSCRKCDCNGHSCQLNSRNQVECNCRPPYSGRDCTTVGESSTDTPRPPLSESTVTVRITSPTIKIEEIGGSVNFSCFGQSRMTSNRLPITWIKDGGDLPQGRSYVDSRSGLLVISNLQFSDSGRYICQTTDGVSTAQAAATLKVPSNNMTAPIITILPAINEYYEGERIQLDCQATGNPAPRISWQRAANSPLPRSSESFGSLFIIENARREDSGEYRCIATNEFGPTVRNAFITILPRPSMPPRERLTITPSSSTVSEGQNTRVVCTGSAFVKAGTIQWVRQDGTEFLSNVRSENGILYIESARPENQGVYICQTTSSDVSPEPIVVNVVMQGPIPETSNITVSVTQLKVPTGGSGFIDCTPTGYPAPLIRWRKHQGEFGSGTSQRENTLIISNAQESDQGYYQCEGIVDGQSVMNQYVFVEIEKRERPTVEIWPNGEHPVSLGTQFEFQCRVNGVPEPTVTWDRSGGRTLSTYAHLIPPYTLKFDRIDVNDEGEYTCSATNVAGTASASAVLKVRSPPEIMLTPSTYVQPAPGESVTVECRASGYPNPTVSIISTQTMREVVPPSQGMAVLRIRSVSDRDEGDYICRATSAAGTIDEQFVIRIDNPTDNRGDGGSFSNGGSGDGDLPETNSNQPSNLVAVEGETRSISCDVPESTLRVDWRRVDRELQSNAVQQGNMLIIYNVSKSDSGQYECTFIDVRTNEAQGAAYTNFKVGLAPRITLRPKTQTVKPGQSPTVECVVDADDIKDISWKPVNRPLSERVEIREATLTFHQIEVEDAGQYECFARNIYGNASAAAEVIVSEDTDRETSESHENEQYAHVGVAVHLSCNVTQPNLRIQWTKNGGNIPRSVQQKIDGSLFIKLAQKSDSGRYVCIIRDQYGRQTSNYINLHIEGPREPAPNLVKIDQPRRQFRVGENVQVTCQSNSRDTVVTWERYNNQQRQYVETRRFGGGATLVVSSVQDADAGVYRCTGQDPFGRTYYEDFNLEVQPASIGPGFVNNQNLVYTARLGKSVDLPCTHNLEGQVSIEWRREYQPLPPNVRSNEPIVYLERITEADAGTYVCRVSNGRNAVEARAILRVEGVVPRFDQTSWISLPTLTDAYVQFDIEISFKPEDDNGLILYNSDNQGRAGDYLALQLVNGVPQFTFETGTGNVVLNGDRPLQLNKWHTVRLSRTNSKVTMDVDNTGPFTKECPSHWILDLHQPLYIGGVPDPNQLPVLLAGAPGFIGCVSMLVLGREEKNVIEDSIEKYNIQECDSCAPNLCLNNGVCQEARNERGYMCVCASGYAGLNCDRTGEACRPGLCGPGKCADTADGYHCACPVPYTGTNCDVKQSIEYPAFTGSAYLAIKAPKGDRNFRMSMKIKATYPVTDGIIMYCAESSRGHGGFTSLAVHRGRLEFLYDLGDDSTPVVLTSNRNLPANEWTIVDIARVGPVVSLKINMNDSYERSLQLFKQSLHLDNMPMFVGGVDDSIVLNNNTGVTGGFNGCIKDVTVFGQNVDIVNSSIQSANVQECSNYDRGDIPEIADSVCSPSLCRNNGTCASPDATSCTCRPGFAGAYCESRLRTSASDPCSAQPCRNGGTCRVDRSMRMNYKCDCPLHYSGTTCHIVLDLLQSVGFNGDGYLALNSQYLQYDRQSIEPVTFAIAFHTTNDGVLLYQREDLTAASYGDFILLRVEQGRVVLDWDIGSGISSLEIDDVFVSDGERHAVYVELKSNNFITLSVDRDHSKSEAPTGLSNVMNADSNVYLGGIPERYNVQRYPGLNGCIEQVEMMGSKRSLNLAEAAVNGKNTQRCRDPGSI